MVAVDLSRALRGDDNFVTVPPRRETQISSSAERAADDFPRRRVTHARGNLQGNRCMVRVNKPMAAGLALGLAISTLATPSFAQRSDEGGMSSPREKALRGCNGEAGKMTQHTWGDHQVHKYRSCMMQKGEQE
jgi:hypothetical protein